MPDKLDIRVLKTQRALAETLVALLEKKPFAKITVNDICTDALVSRSTFYLHFEDKYQLARFCLQREREAVAQLASQMDLHDILLAILTRIKQSEKLYRNMLRAEMNVELSEMLRDHLKHPFEMRLRQRAAQGYTLTGSADLLASFYAAGTTGAILHWIESGYRDTLEEVADCLDNLFTNALVFGSNDSEGDEE